MGFGPLCDIITVLSNSYLVVMLLIIVVSATITVSKIKSIYLAPFRLSRWRHGSLNPTGDDHIVSVCCL